MDYGVSLAFTVRRLRSILCVGYHAHRCCFRSGRLCLAKACCLACWQGNLPDYDILVKCVLREANCVSCARVMARGAVSRLASVKGSCPGSTEHRHAFFLPQTPRAPLRAAFVFYLQLLVLRVVVPLWFLPRSPNLKTQNHHGTTAQRRELIWTAVLASIKSVVVAGTRHYAFLQPNRSVQYACGNWAKCSALHKLLAARQLRRGTELAKFDSPSFVPDDTDGFSSSFARTGRKTVRKHNVRLS